MSLLRTVTLGVLGFLGYKYYHMQTGKQNEAFAEGQAGGENTTQVRDAGPEAMADPPVREWTKVDEQGDESFPASDPPANY
ncbi:hypothetical protein GCM10009127_02870 [Alteraurantiacibacter aestuarii]|uniref:Uncharacterized protein n=1 Tax=Alteraurantiacibacter aestuarii TaxID=650004 RepID=A0A844ZS82_9SPHN|nr:hypothetical protein [Alteraurantiacibacter aestuarii]MXO88459.1 hypothetical protein [Alteraurantiacibacter aestuarii]